jgi:hypothetical protein
MQCRTFLAAASVGSFARLASAQSSTAETDVPGNKVFYRRCGILGQGWIPRYLTMQKRVVRWASGDDTGVLVRLFLVA